jgi:hypothetical protein
MRAELRRIHSPDVADLRSWSPPAEEFAVLIQLVVGPSGEPGEESFDVTLCTASWLARRAGSDGVIDARHHVVMESYDYDRVEQYFTRRVSACEGATWREVAAKVGRIGRWEFEDYTG